MKSRTTGTCRQNFRGTNSVTNAKPILRGLVLMTGLLLAAACGRNDRFETPAGLGQLDPARMSFAISEVMSLQANGQRVWCVPFARNASGIQIRGDAHTWWAAAEGEYRRGKKPSVGAVMVFSKSSSLTRGHVAVVSRVVSKREVLIDHANWSRNQISRSMSVIDVSKRGDWSAVRVESIPGAYGSTYPVSGFIYPNAYDT